MLNNTSFLKLFIVLILMVGRSVCAQQDTTNDYSFKLLPAICVLTKDNFECQQEVTIEFKNKLPSNICIYIVNNIASKKCYFSDDVLTFGYNVNTTTSVELVIENQLTHQVLGKSLFKVTQYKPMRKRRRFTWSLL